MTGQPDLRFEEGMRREHCSKEGCDHMFVTSNYNIETCAKREWFIVVDKRDDLADMGNKRRLLDISELMLLPMVQKSRLTRHEVIAVVLYTGPMVTFRNLARTLSFLADIFAAYGLSSSLSFTAPVSTWCTTRYFGVTRISSSPSGQTLMPRPSMSCPVQYRKSVVP